MLLERIWTEKYLQANVWNFSVCYNITPGNENETWKWACLLKFHVFVTVHKYLALQLNHMTPEWMQIVRFSPKDRSHVVGCISEFFIQCNRGLIFCKTHKLWTELVCKGSRLLPYSNKQSNVLCGTEVVSINAGAHILLEKTQINLINRAVHNNLLYSTPKESMSHFLSLTKPERLCYLLICSIDTEMLSILHVDIISSLLDEILNSKQAQIPEQCESWSTYTRQRFRSTVISWPLAKLQRWDRHSPSPAQYYINLYSMRFTSIGMTWRGCFPTS